LTWAEFWYALSDLVYRTDSAELATTGKVTAEDHQQTILKDLDLPSGSFSLFEDEFWGGDRLDSHLIDFIRGLRGEFTTVLLSNAWDNLRHLLREFWKIDGLFDHIFISAELELAKPDPAIYKHVIDKLGQDPSELLFIDDFSENIEAAREAGINAIHFRNRDQALFELAEYLNLEI